MIIFNSDLDNTLIYSYKRDIGLDKICTEIYKDREVSFMTRSSYELLKEINRKLIFVPTTTRTIEQYNRINLGIGTPKYALTCNGGILLVDGKMDTRWYEKSLEITANCREELITACEYLERDEYRSMEVRNIQDLFVFTKSSEPEKTIIMLESLLDTSKVDMFQNGVKVYVVPKMLNKGNSVKRLREKLNAECLIAAGDSEFDIPLIKEADIGIAPASLRHEFALNKKVHIMEDDGIYADNLLNFIKYTLQ